MRSHHLHGVECCDDAELIVSELVTNAVRAGSHLIEVHLSAADHELCIGVSDDAVGEVVVEAPGPERTHGRGLQIVSDLAVDWGVCVEHDAKNVWATVGIPDAAGG